jgi:hypothetical protein
VLGILFILLSVPVHVTSPPVACPIAAGPRRSVPTHWRHPALTSLCGLRLCHFCFANFFVVLTGASFVEVSPFMSLSRLRDFRFLAFGEAIAEWWSRSLVCASTW